MTLKTTKVAVWAIALIWIVVGVISVLPAAFSVMMFDAPGSDERPATIALAAAVCSFPLVCFGAAGHVMMLEPARKYSHGAWALALPLVNLLVASAAAAWIEAFQGGRFNG